MTDTGPSLYRTVEERLRQLEIQHQLFDYEVDGWCVWPRLRFWVATVLYDLPLSESPSAGFSLAGRAQLALRDLPRLLKPRRARQLIKTYSGALLEQAGPRFKDVFFDDLLNQIGDFYKLETISRPGDWPRSQTALIKRDVTTAWFDLAPGVLARLRQPRQISDVARSLSACLQRETGRAVFSERLVRLHLLNFYWSKQLYGRLLDRVQPRYVLTADPGEYALAAAAKEHGVQVLEYQHGFLDRDQHPAYAFAAHAAPYRARMPIPDRLLLYGEYWRQELAANHFWGEALRVVGSLRMDHYRHRRAATSRSDVCSIVLTTQGIDVPKLIEFVADFAAQLDRAVDYRLTIKLHPFYETSKALYEAAFATNPRIEVFLGGEAPSTFELLSRAHLHLSVSSTCHYDALGLGVPTVILPLTTYQVVQQLHAQGQALLARTPADLADIVRHWREHAVPADNSELYFQSGALENFKRELEVMT